MIYVRVALIEKDLMINLLLHNFMINYYKVIIVNDDIEILDDVIDKKDDISNEEESKNKKCKKNKNKKDNIELISDERRKRKMKLWEKIVLIFNVVIILGIIGYYAYRTIYYYKLTHNMPVDKSLMNTVTKLDNIIYNGDGLYQKDDFYYFKGREVNNYVYYSGRIWRIISLGDEIKLINNDIESSIVWGVNMEYKDSYINKWLNNYANTLRDSDTYLVNVKWCNMDVMVNEYACEVESEGLVGLLTTEEYLRAGGNASFLNNEEHWWTINYGGDKQAFYVNNKGSINNVVKNGDNYISYGVRPVINLSNTVTFRSGDGTLEKPYVIEELGQALLQSNAVGSYVKYNNYVWRILSNDETGTELIMEGILNTKKSYNDVYSYLNSTFIKEFNKEELVKTNYVVSNYNASTKFDYSVKGTDSSNYVRIPSIGELFTTEYDGYWFNNILNSTLKLAYTISDVNTYFGDLKGNKNFVRPIIKLNADTVINSGTGTKDDPLVIGDVNEESEEGI